MQTQKKSETQMGFEPMTLRDLVGCSNHWATGDSMVSKGHLWDLTGTASRGYTASDDKHMWKLTNSITLPHCSISRCKPINLQIEYIKETTTTEILNVGRNADSITEGRGFKSHLGLKFFPSLHFSLHLIPLLLLFL